MLTALPACCKESVAECEKARQNNPQVKINSSAINSYLYLGEYDKFLQSLPANDSVYILFYHGFAEYYLNNRDQAAKISIALSKETLRCFRRMWARLSAIRSSTTTRAA